MEINSIQDFVNFKYDSAMQIRKEFTEWKNNLFKTPNDFFKGFDVQAISSKDGALLDCKLHDVEIRLFPTPDNDVDNIVRDDRETYRGGETHEVFAIMDHGSTGGFTAVTSCMAPKGCRIDWDKVLCAFQIDF